MTATLGTIYYIAPEVIKGYLECDGFEWSVVCDVCFFCLKMDFSILNLFFEILAHFKG